MSSADPSVFVKSNEAGVERVRESNGGYAFLAGTQYIKDQANSTWLVLLLCSMLILIFHHFNSFKLFVWVYKKAMYLCNNLSITLSMAALELSHF